MRSNRATGTTPELKLRQLLRKRGLTGYRINLKTLPGKPDIVFTRWHVAVYLHGCFWHGCPKCARSSSKTNTQFWTDKIRRNRERDELNAGALKKQGYAVLVIWEHQLKTETEEVVDCIDSALQRKGRR